MSAALLAAIVMTQSGAPSMAAPDSQLDTDNTVLAAAQSGDWNPRRQQVQSAQTWLRQLGYNPGNTAGAVTEEMRLALRLYQRDNDLSENGRLTRKTFEHLRAKAGTAAAPTPAKPVAAAPPEPPTTSATIEPVLEPSAPPPAAATDSPALFGEAAPMPSETRAAFQLSQPVLPPAEQPPTAPATIAALPNTTPAPADQQLAEVRTGHVSSETAPSATANLTPTIDPANDENAQANQTQTAMIVPRPQLCGSPVGGSWLVKDENGSEFALILRGDGTVAGPLYPQYWTWRPTDLGVEIGYSNEMGQRVVRHGALRGSAAIAGEATDSRGRTWSWSAIRAIDAATTADTACAKVGPA